MQTVSIKHERVYYVYTFVQPSVFPHTHINALMTKKHTHRESQQVVKLLSPPNNLMNH
jgi:hypothetical protein